MDRLWYSLAGGTWRRTGGGLRTTTIFEGQALLASSRDYEYVSVWYRVTKQLIMHNQLDNHNFKKRSIC